MGKYKITEDEIKDDIFNIYSKCKNEASRDRRQVLSGQLCEKIFIWCRDYHFGKTAGDGTDYPIKEAEKMGEEIFQVSIRIVKEKSKANVPVEKDGFFQYLKKALDRGKAYYYRESESGIIKIPKEKKMKLKKAENVIKMKESYLGRTLTNDERVKCVSEWFNAQEYTDILNTKRIRSIEFVYENNEIDLLNTVVTPLYPGNTSNDPSGDYIAGVNTEIYREAIQSVLQRRQERTRACCKALFTLYFFEKYKDLEGLIPVLDSEILEACRKDREKPNQYEIYLKYHPEAKKDSAAVRASETLQKFLHDLKTCFKEKNPDLYE